MTEPTGTEEPKNATLSFKQLKQLIADTVEGAFSSREAQKIDDKAQDPPARRQLRQQEKPTRSVEDEVQAALTRLEKEKEAREADAAREGRIAALEDKTKEKAPIERRKVHKVMGWGEN